MQVLQNVPLALHSTMRLGGPAAFLAEVYSADDIVEADRWAKEHHLPTIVIGSGSNIVWQDSGYPGLVIVNKLKGFDLQEGNGHEAQLTVAAGEIWDSVVERTVSAGYSGIEALSLIPGTVGATPVQNVGAYGQEIAQVLIEVRAFDTTTSEQITITNGECRFQYRSSRFKTTDHGRFLITHIVLRLSKSSMRPPLYASLQEYLDVHHVTDFSPQSIRDAVIAIRSSKLPDPTRVANNGSFFANPVIDQDHFRQLQQSFQDVPHWKAPSDKIKLSAAWLIDQVGFRDYHDQETGMATWPKQSLILINEHARSTSNLLRFRQKIIDAVQTKFDVTLEQEPELLP